jgi:hypothetical protein
VDLGKHTLVLAPILIASICAAARGAQLAYDSAGDSAYNNGWTAGSNGGYGWGGGWNFTGVSPGPIIGDSTTNGAGPTDGFGDINSPQSPGGRAWGLLSGTALRTFSGSLDTGQRFLVDLDDFGFASPNFSSSVFLIPAGQAPVVGVLAGYGPDYLVSFPDGLRVDSGVAETDHGLHLSFAQTPSDVQVSLTPVLGGTSRTISVPYSGQLLGVEFESQGPGSSGLTWPIPYINNIAITPEPEGAGLVSLAAGGLLLRRRRQH